MDSLAFLERERLNKVHPIYVLHGDEAFLKRRVQVALRVHLLGSEAEQFGLSSYAGDKATFAAIHDELQTLPFLGSRRLVVVENADPFVTLARTRLEHYAAQPSPTGVLVLDVKTWPSNTRLAKLVDSDATIICKAPAAYRVAAWCSKWCSAQYGKQLTDGAARLLVDLAGTEMGMLDQEIQKLVIYVGKAERIEEQDVDRLVGASRAENTFKIFDAIGSGQSAQALAMLDRLFEQGEEPLAMLGAFSWQLRRLAEVARRNALGQPLPVAMAETGVPPFAQRGCEQQLRHLGRERLDRLYDWLLEVDLGIKGFSQLSPQTLLERLVIRLVG